MNYRTIIIIASVLIGITLCITGAVICIGNFLNPVGHLFEGVVLFSIGVSMMMLIIIASALGNTMTQFGEILANQKDLISNKTKPMDIGSIMSSMMREGDTGIQITNLNTGETTSTPFDFINNQKGSLMDAILRGAGSIKKNLDQMTLDELEKELKLCLDSENFERATEVRNMIQSKRN